jgi:hypothetical protein
MEFHSKATLAQTTRVMMTHCALTFATPSLLLILGLFWKFVTSYTRDFHYYYSLFVMLEALVEADFETSQTA